MAVTESNRPRFYYSPGCPYTAASRQPRHEDPLPRPHSSAGTWVLLAVIAVAGLLGWAWGSL